MLNDCFVFSCFSSISRSNVFSLWPAAVCLSVAASTRSKELHLPPSWEQTWRFAQMHHGNGVWLIRSADRKLPETESHNVDEVQRRLLQPDQSELQVILNYCRKVEIKIFSLFISACWWSGFLHWSTFFPDINLLSLIFVLFCFLLNIQDRIWFFRSGHL